MPEFLCCSFFFQTNWSPFSMNITLELIYSLRTRSFFTRAEIQIDETGAVALSPDWRRIDELKASCCVGFFWHFCPPVSLRDSGTMRVGLLAEYLTRTNKTATLLQECGCSVWCVAPHCLPSCSSPGSSQSTPPGPTSSRLTRRPRRTGSPPASKLSPSPIFTTARATAIASSASTLARCVVCVSLYVCLAFGECYCCKCVVY